jgi:hypothetical protein
MHNRVFAAAAACLLSVSAANAGLVSKPVAVSVVVGNAAGTSSLTVASGNAARAVNLPSDVPGNLGNSLNSTVPFLADYAANLENGVVGPHGGKIYDVTLRTGSKGAGRFGQWFANAALPQGTKFGGETINSLSVSYGVTGGGLSFDDFSGVNVLYYAGNISAGAGALKVDSNLAGTFEIAGSLGTPAYINADGTVGVSYTLDADAMFLNGTDVSNAFGGDLTAFAVMGSASSFMIEVAPVPEPTSPGLAAIAGLGLLRRGRRSA